MLFKRLLIILALFTTTLLAYNGPFYVSKSGNDTTGNGAIATPFLTIQRGADRIAIGTNITSATLYINPGVYNEQVVLRSNKSTLGMTIVASSNTKPIIDGQATRGYGITLYPQQWYNPKTPVNIERLVIRNVITNGIRAEGYWNSYIKNCIFSNRSALSALNLTYFTSNILIQGNVFYSNNVTLESGNNVFRSNIIYAKASQIGINFNVLYTFVNSKITISKNRIIGPNKTGEGAMFLNTLKGTVIVSSNYIGGWATAIRPDYITNALYSYNTLTNNNFHCFLFRCDNNVFKRNTSYAAANNFINMNSYGADFGNNNQVISNTSYLDTTALYIASGESNIIIQGNSFIRGVNTTIESYANGTSIDNNSFISNSGSSSAVILNAIRGGYVRGNVFVKSPSSSIQMLNSCSNNYVSRNTISLSAENGIRVINTSKGNTFSSNTIYKNGSTHYGIVFENTSSKNRIFNNIIYSNYRGIGFSTSSSVSNSINNNKLYRNSNRGLVMDNISFSTVVRNAFFRNGGDAGIVISGNSDFNRIINNTLCSNAGDNIQSQGGDVNNTIFYNNIVVFAPSVGITANATLNVYYSDVFGNTSANYADQAIPVRGNITNNPLFVSFDPLSTDFLTLSSNSPCIDKATNILMETNFLQRPWDMGWKEREYLPKNLLQNYAFFHYYHSRTNLINIHYTNKLGVRPNAYPVITANVITTPKSYIVGSMSLVSLWTNEFSTNTNPGQSYYSTDYNATDSTNVKWIRWKKLNMGLNESGNLTYKVRKLR